MAGEKILIIEDEPDVALMLSNLLGEQGYRTHVACNGMDGLGLARQECPSLILLDLRLPQLGGMELLSRLGEDKFVPPVIIVTALGSEELALTALRLGVKDYIKKPFDPAELLEVVERALAEGRLRRERDRFAAQLKTANKNLTLRLSQLAALYQIGQALTAMVDLDQVLSLILEEARQILGVRLVSIFLLDQASGDLVSYLGKKGDDGTAVALRLRPGEGIAGWVAQHAEPALVPDAQKDARFKPTFDRITGIATESVLCVPLLVGGQVVGVIQALNKPHPGFTQDDLIMLRALSMSAAVAIENAQLYEKLRESRDQVAERSADLRKVLNKLVRLQRMALELGTLTVGAELKEVYGRLTEHAATLMEVKGSTILLFEPDRQELVCQQPAFGPAAEFGHFRMHLSPTHPIWSAWQKGQSLVVNHVDGSPLVKALGLERLLRDMDVRSMMCAVLRSGGRSIGMFQVFDKLNGTDFTTDDQRVLEIYAGQSAIAIENARFFTGEQHRMAKMGPLLEEWHKISDLLNSPADIETVLNNILHAVTAITGATDACLLLLEEEGPVTAYRERRGQRIIDKLRLDDIAPLLSIPAGQRSVLVRDLYDRTPDRKPWLSACRQLFPGARALACASLLNTDQKQIGLLALASAERDRFGPDDLQVMEATANQAALAIRNQRCLQSVRSFEEQQVEAERIAALGDIAGNMVHRINNAVGAIRPLIQQIEIKLDQGKLEDGYLREKLKRIRTSADHTLEVVEQIRRPFQWVTVGPVDVNESIAAAWSELQPPVGVQVDIAYNESLPPVTATRQLDEVFRNLMKNALDAMAQAGGVLTVRGRKLDEHWIDVIFTDTGPGIPSEIRDKIFQMGSTTKPGGTGFGLWWSRTFLRRLGGDIVLDSSGDKGCVFRVTLPVSGDW